MGQILHFGNQLAERTTDLRTTHRGNDAEGTGIVATDLHSDPTCMINLAAGRQRRRECLTVRPSGCLEDLDYWAVLRRMVEQLDSPINIVRSEHHIHMSRTLADEVTVLLRQTTPDHNLQVRIDLFQRLEIAQRAIELVVGVLPYATGVENDDIGLCLIIDPPHPVGLKETGDPF